MREFNIEGESDEEDKVTNKEFYNESCLPDFLKDPTYYLTKHLDGITDEQLAEMSEDELVNKKSEKRREQNKEHTALVMDQLEKQLDKAKDSLDSMKTLIGANMDKAVSYIDSVKEGNAPSIKPQIEPLKGALGKLEDLLEQLKDES